MGNQQPAARPKKVSLDDAVIQMKIQSKQIQRAAKNSQKQSQKYLKKAKQSLKKNNQQGAKLFLMSASSKKTQSLNYQRTAAKMDIMCQRIKSNANNEQLINSFSNLTQVISQQMGQTDMVKMTQSMQSLDNKMTQMMINGKMMQQIMQQNEIGQSTTVDQMMNVLKQQLTLQDANNLNIMPQQTNINQNAQINKKQQAHYDPFMDQLKDL